MTFLGTLFKKTQKFKQAFYKHQASAFHQQRKELKQLLKKAKHTRFGKVYDFEGLLQSDGFQKKNKKTHYNDFFENFKARIPVHNYEKMYNDWWHQSLNGEADISWPGSINYFALTSGTSEASTKYIPITPDMLKAIQKTGVRQFMALVNYDIPPKLYAKGILMVGGTTSLNLQEHFYEGDLSGITASRLPAWFYTFYKPGKKIAQTKDWNEKLDKITYKAKDWDIGYIVGVPAWIQLLLERIIDYYNLNNIHEIWPNLSVFTHGGVSFEPYKKGFEKLLGKPLTYIETYLASEGFIAFQVRPGGDMKMVLNNGLFYEFVPFNEDNFDEDGNMVPNPESYMIHQVKEGTEYALLLSTCAGAWRYQVGDVIKFTDKERYEIVITGRTKHFISLCGEHLSVDNMNKAIHMVEEQLNITVREFTVAGIHHGSMFAHKWYIGTDDDVDNNVLKEKLDANIKELNDDYATERIAALQEVYVETLPNSVFYEYLRAKGKEGGQNKFPRVLKKTQFEDWENFVNNNQQTTSVGAQY